MFTKRIPSGSLLFVIIEGTVVSKHYILTCCMMNFAKMFMSEHNFITSKISSRFCTPGFYVLILSS